MPTAEARNPAIISQAPCASVAASALIASRTWRYPGLSAAVTITVIQKKPRPAAATRASGGQARPVVAWCRVSSEVTDILVPFNAKTTSKGSPGQGRKSLVPACRSGVVPAPLSAPPTSAPPSGDRGEVEQDRLH